MHRLSIITSSLIVCWILLLCSPLQAQSTSCLERQKTFLTPLQSRFALESHLLANQYVDQDLWLETLAQQSFQQSHRFKVYLSSLTFFERFQGIKVCPKTLSTKSNQGSLRNAFVFGVDDEHLDLSLRYTTTLTFFWAQFHGVDDGINPAVSQTFFSGAHTHALRLRIKSWLAISWGKMFYTPVTSFGASEDTQQAYDIRDRTSDFIRVESPTANLSFNILLNDAYRELDTIYIDLQRIPVPTTPLDASLKIAFMRNEAQYYSVLGLDWSHHTFGASTGTKKRHHWDENDQHHITKYTQNLRTESDYRLGLDLATEYNTLNVRFLRLRADFDYRRFSHQHLKDQKEPSSKEIEHMILGIHLETSIFNGQYLEKLYEKDLILGGQIGLKFGWSYSIGRLYLDASIGKNKADSLSQNVQTLDALEQSLQLRLQTSF